MIIKVNNGEKKESFSLDETEYKCLNNFMNRNVKLVKLKSKVSSKIDNVIKYTFVNRDNYVLEFSYINKNDGKHIICAPNETMCNVGCKFCHCTDHIGKIKSEKIDRKEYLYIIEFILQDLYLFEENILISFMGIGEPLNNVFNIVGTMYDLNLIYENIRFGLATCIPKRNFKDFIELVNDVSQLKLNCKLHLSLHYTNDVNRKKWMLNSLDILPSLDLCSLYKSMTGNKVEVHYALIDGINDSVYNAYKVVKLLYHRDFNFKILFFNEKESLEAKKSNRLQRFQKILNEELLYNEYYVPPGLDVGASCGQFLMENYNETN